MIKAGDRVEILPEWQDACGGEWTYVAVDDEGKGRVTIEATNTGFTIAPQEVVLVEWLRKL